MHNNKNSQRRFLPVLIAGLSTLSLSQLANAEIMLYDKDQTTFSTDGYVNTFYVNSKVDRPGDQYDRSQARVKMGFLPNYIGFNMGKQVDDLKLGARASLWVTINDSQTNGTATAIDVRQFYGTVAKPEWGEVLIGKDFGLFARSNILLDEMLSGYGQVSDTLGLVDGGGVSFGNIGTGYPYPFPTSQITYRSPIMDGLRVAVGIMDPVDTNNSSALGKAYQNNPRTESEVTYQFDAAGAKVYSWVNGSYQTSDNTDSTVASVTSKGLGYGVQAKMGGVTLTGSGFRAKGINPFFTNNAGEATLREVDSVGYLMQGSYKLGKNRLALSYGKTNDDGNGVVGSGANYDTRGIALFHDVNSSLQLVVEYNQFEIRGHETTALNETTNTFAVGAVLTW
ncbi:porin [Pseudomonas sp. RTC3]|uniref:porin n=1 Tax=unclassified Pseudomonas TaxID=196821 RepID=UPI002AB56A3D|nr:MULTISPECIES: porin [unclassified Pseudomonas]MEB0063516.1 porin [Pseudomonas sp. RTC3]MDY7565090.1 porin [Pseudomonas sp. 5C2]MEB0006115.1 porin [Pseudomonas sp. RTB2]MEB0018378.1 porin [Pseudomonas sp. RTB3]MEB0025188.1 porin [Pseudomonas sp. MH9.2]